MSDSDQPSEEALAEAKRLLLGMNHEVVVVGVARALDRWRNKARQAERNRIAAYIDYHEYDIVSGLLDPLRALRRELGIKEPSE